MLTPPRHFASFSLCSGGSIGGPVAAMFPRDVLIPSPKETSVIGASVNVSSERKFDQV